MFTVIRLFKVFNLWIFVVLCDNLYDFQGLSGLSCVCVCVCVFGWPLRNTFIPTEYYHLFDLRASWYDLTFCSPWYFQVKDPLFLWIGGVFFVSPQSFSELDPWLRQDTWIISLENNACGYGVSEITIYNREFTWFLNFHFMIFVKNKKKINMRLIKVFGGCGSSQ